MGFNRNPLARTEVLVALAEAGRPLTNMEISDRLRLDAYTVRGRLNRMLEAKLVVRTKDAHGPTFLWSLPHPVAREFPIAGYPAALERLEQAVRGWYRSAPPRRGLSGQ
jgi:predicted ArsR family transcriptional regulator